MLAWLLWRLERIERIHEAAGRLISEFGVEAGAEARRREREVNSAEAARDWKRVASVIARRTPKQAALDAATGSSPMEVDTVAEPMLNKKMNRRRSGSNFFAPRPIRAKAI